MKRDCSETKNTNSKSFYSRLIFSTAYTKLFCRYKSVFNDEKFFKLFLHKITIGEPCNHGRRNVSIVCWAEDGFFLNKLLLYLKQSFLTNLFIVSNFNYETEILNIGSNEDKYYRF